MPCNSDHMAPTPQERAMQEASLLLQYLVNAQPLVIAPHVTVEQIAQATSIYAKDVGQVEALCGILTRMPSDVMDRLVYDGRNPTARRLADWWERHQKVDAARQADKPEVSKMLALSTAHITEQTCNQFLATVGYEKGEYGWFVYTNLSVPIPDDLKACLEYARTIDCEWVMFDLDVDPLPQLPTYDW